MFKFLKNIMNNEEVDLTNDDYSLHRILKTDIKKYLLVFHNVGSQFSFPKLFI